MLERLQSALKTVKESKRNYALHFSRHVFAEVAVVGESVSHLSVCMSLQGFRILRATLKLSRSDVLQSRAHRAFGCAATLMYVPECVVIYSGDCFTVLQKTVFHSHMYVYY